MTGRLVLVLAASWLLLGARGAPAAGSAAAERRFLPAEWEQVGGVAPTDGPELLNPLLIASRGRMLYVVDYGDKAVKAFDWGGRLAWAVGRHGRGPGEFMNPTDVQVDAEGNVWVNDPPNNRVTVLRPDGGVAAMFAPEKPAHRLLPLHDGTFLGIGSAGEGLLGYRYAPGGKVAGTLGLPASLRGVGMLARDGRVAVAPTGRAVVITFLYGDRLILWNSAARRLTALPGVEPVAFPGLLHWRTPEGARVTRLALDATRATLSVTADDRFAYLLFGGRTAQAGRIVDRYELATGRYAGSYLLPQPVTGITAVPGGFAALIADPVPEIRVWRLTTG